VELHLADFAAERGLCVGVACSTVSALVTVLQSPRGQYTMPPHKSIGSLFSGLHGKFIETIKPTLETNKAQASFFAAVKKFSRHEDYVARHSDGAADRIAVYDLQSIQDGSPQLLAATEQHIPLNELDKERSPQTPEIKALPAAVRDPLVTRSLELRKSVETYLLRFINNELRQHADLALVAAASEENYRAVVSFDYFGSRPLTGSGAHKDTMGNTLFVMLHYNNTETMQGPEYAIDMYPMPVKGKGKSKEVNPVTFAKRKKLQDARIRAPWRVIENSGGMTFWPPALLHGLELARERLRKEQPGEIFYSSLIEKKGMVVFVDELLFHITPVLMRRDPHPDGDRQQEFRDAGLKQVGGKKSSNMECLVFPGTAPMAVQRQLSGTLKEWDAEDAKNKAKMFGRLNRTGPRPDGTGGMKERRFNRIWIQIVPASWYENV
jgi:hypothetical protein